MSLAGQTLAALLVLARPPAVDAVAERPRLEALAAAVAGVVDERHELPAWLGYSAAPLPFGGPGAREKTALALVAIAYHEGALRADVSDCRRVGSFEHSISLWQLHGPFAHGPYSETELCSSVRLAAERALWVLAHHAARAPTAAAVFAGYASGSVGRPSRAAARQCTIWMRLCHRAGILASCEARP